MNPLAPAGAAARILLIEDNRGDAVLVEHMLVSVTAANGQTYTLTHASTLEDGCVSLLTDPADCVLLDLSLPDAHGLEAVKRMRAAAPDLPIVVLTGNDDEELGLGAVAEGAQDYLVKGRADDRMLGRAVRYAIERKRAELALAHQALHDPLTGLPNRLLFIDRVEHALARKRRRENSVAVLFLDLDRFKVIHDSLGHEFGNHVLEEVARRLTDGLRPGDTVARFGGDKFTLLCEELDDAREALGIAERLTSSLAGPVAIGETEIQLAASVGIAVATGSAAEASDLVRDSEAAMYRAKERGGGLCELFDAGLRARTLERLDVESGLHRAIDRDELRLHYQPIVALPTGGIVAVEALVRWEHPTRGLLQPDAFVPLAEETGQIVAVGSWVLHEACRQAQLWGQAHADAVRMSVNISARQLAHADLVDTVRSALRQTGLEPSSLVLEVTESAIVADVEAASRAVRAIRDEGVQIAIDDFGTGYASLRLLQQLPADVLKIDRSFVAGLGSGDDRDMAIVAAVVRLAKELGLVAIAEGIESHEQAAALTGIGCDLAQGFHYARPGPPDVIGLLLREGTGPLPRGSLAV